MKRIVDKRLEIDVKKSGFNTHKKKGNDEKRERKQYRTVLYNAV